MRGYELGLRAGLVMGCGILWRSSSREDIALYCIIPNRRLYKPTCAVYPSPWHMWSG